MYNLIQSNNSWDLKWIIYLLWHHLKMMGLVENSTLLPAIFSSVTDYFCHTLSLFALLIFSGHFQVFQENDFAFSTCCMAANSIAQCLIRLYPNIQTLVEVSGHTKTLEYVILLFVNSLKQRKILVGLYLKSSLPFLRGNTFAFHNLLIIYKFLIFSA